MESGAQMLPGYDFIKFFDHRGGHAKAVRLMIKTATEVKWEKTENP